MTGYRASRLPQHRGRAAWNEIIGAQPVPNVLSGDRTADIVVIGAGFAGLSAARRLHQIDPTARIVVLDAGRVAEGAAGRNSGFMIDLPHDLASEDYAGSGDDKAQIALNRRAIAFARDAVEAYGIEPAFFDEVGKVNGAVGQSAQAHNRRYAEHLNNLGEACELLDARQMRALTGSAYYASGLYTPGTVMLQPAGYIRGLAAGLSSAVDLYENTAATGFARSGDSWDVFTKGGKIAAQKIILTVNGHLESFGFARRRLLQVFLFAMMTRDLGGDAPIGAPRWGITPSDPMGTTMRRIDPALGGNRIVTRTCAVMRPGMTVGLTDMGRAAKVMLRKFDSRFPALAGTKMDYIWAGHLCLSLNGVAVAGELRPGVFSGCVQNGLGTARGTLTGIAAAEAALGVTSDIGEHFAAEPPPKRLPPMTRLGANMVMRWREWRARDE